MKNGRIFFVRLVVLGISVIFLSFVLSGCNEEGKIWAKYTSESFSFAALYEAEGEQVCFTATVLRNGGEGSATVNFSSPEALERVEGSIDSQGCALTLDGIVLEGESAEDIRAELERFGL